MPSDNVRCSVSVVIPTYQREQTLIDTITHLLNLPNPAAEILVIDQTERHDSATQQQLNHWHGTEEIRLIKQDKPSITDAMNRGLMLATQPLVLYLDDDIIPRGDLVSAHEKAHQHDTSLWATVGQIVQPWQEPEDLAAPRRTVGLRRDEDFPFHSTREMEVSNVMAGNLCVNRELALSIGGFDLNFQSPAYRFETEFAKRISDAQGKIRFLGQAGIDHLRVTAGGTRSRGSHLTSASPRHGVGDHYYALLHAPTLEANLYCLRRIFREVRTKFHLTHPWWIPVKLIGEMRAYLLARRLRKQGPRTLLNTSII